MHKKLVLLYCLSVFLFFFVQVNASVQLPAAEAQEKARNFIQRTAQYSLENPDAPSAMPEWIHASPGIPLLVHRYPDLKATYYLVPVVNHENKVISLVSIDADDGKWNCYVKFESRDSLFKVDKEEAAGLFLETFRVLAPFDSIFLVIMSDKNLYWYHKGEGGDSIDEYFVNVSEPTDIFRKADAETPDPMALSGSYQGDLFKLTGETPVKGAHPTNELPVTEFLGDHISEELKSDQTAFFYPSSYDISTVPHYYQLNTYLSGPASLEMIMDYWDLHIFQPDIEHVANTIPAAGTELDDLRRASHFSSSSTAIQDPALHGYNERALGYGSLDNWWSYPDETDPDYVDRYDDLKTLLSSGYPVLLLTWYDTSHSMEHYRVVKGYNDDTNVFIVHDPWYVLPYLGPDVNFNQEVLVDDLWMVSDRWGLLSSPWSALIASPATVTPGEHFSVSATIEYGGPHPYEGQDTASDPQAAISLPDGFTLETGETEAKSLTGIGSSDSSDSVSWNVIAPAYEAIGMITIEAKGSIDDSSSSYPAYSDWIGTVRQVQVQALSSDADGDGLGDTLDNCPSDHNPDQLDNDNDGTGDLCDPDDDNDGYDDVNDCAPHDSDINPAAIEICDEADNNCDGTVDDDLDIDNDGYVGCGDLDCNDAATGIHPGAVETCNGYDDDCDASIDEGCEEVCDQRKKDGAERRVTQSPQNSSRSSLVWTGSEYGIFWHDDRDGNYEIYFARLAPSGNKIGTDTRVTNAPGTSSYPSAVWTGSEYGVSWHDYRDGNYEIYFARLDASGSKLGSDMRVTNDPAISDYASLVWNGSEYGLAWQDIQSAAWEIYFAQLDSSGKKIGSETRVTNSSKNSTQASLVWTGSEYGVAWEDSRMGDYEIYFARLDSSGSKIGSDVRVTNFLWHSLFVSLVWTGSEYGLSWEDSRNFNKEIYFARLDTAGNKIGFDTRITNNSASSVYASLAWDGTEYGISWEDTRDGNSEIYFARVDASGSKVGSDVRVTFDGSGSYGTYDRYMIWTGSRYGISLHDTRDGNYEIYLSHVKCCDLSLDADSDTYNECEDCNDNDSAAHPGAAEICDGTDNDCNWEIDEGFPVPGMTAGLIFQANKQTMNWNPALDADRYDIVKGDLMSLISSTGDFTSSLNVCLEDDSFDTEAGDPDDPASGEGFYYLIRAQDVCKYGTYNTDQASQIEDRDAEIESSPNKCP